MTDNAMQFDGTLGSAKAIAAWVNDPTKIVCGPGYLIDQGASDTAAGGVDLITSDDNGVLYVTAQPTDYVVRSGDDLVVFSAQQYAIAFPDA
jgi:hypothetical protein